MKRNTIGFMLAALIVVSIMGCGNKNGERDMDEASEYELLTVSGSTAVITSEYSATIRGRQDVDIFPQVSGKIVRQCVEEGQRVKYGQTLFVIDQVHYRSELLTATAAEHAALAQVKTAELEEQSKRNLFNKKVVSNYALTEAVNALELARAGYEQSKAQRMNAANNLSYTIVKSPANGVLGNLPYRIGSLVNEQLTKPLTTISDNSQMYVYFSISENELRNLIEKYGPTENIIKRLLKVSLILSDGSIYQYQGHIEAISGIIDPQTGSISVRSVFDNPEHQLLSGGIGNVVLKKYKDNALVVPQTAVFEIQDKYFAYRVIKGRAVLTPIKIQDMNDGKNYLVTVGLKMGDVIIADGANSVKDGMAIEKSSK